MSEQTQVSTIQANERYLSFSMGPEEFAIPLLAVKEVIAVPEFTPIPHTPNYFLGIMNLRGQVISVLDLRKKLGVQPKNGTEDAVIICDLNPLVLGILVDSVNSVLSPREDEILPKPPIESKISTEYITAVYRRNDHLVLFLEISKALNTQDLMALKQQNHKKIA